MARERTVVLAIDGPAASGKTTLAAIIPVLQDCVIVHMDELYDGWDGLAAGVDQASSLISALRDGMPASFQRYDWNAGCYRDCVTVPSTPLLVLEGVGAGAVFPRPDCVIWVEAATPTRAMRADDRGDFGDQWSAWAEQEATHFAAHGTREAADLIIDTTPEAT